MFVFVCTGDSANAVPHYHKCCTRVTHIWGDRRGQPNRSAMERPRPGRTAFVITPKDEDILSLSSTVTNGLVTVQSKKEAFVITVSPVPGKYELLR